MITGHILILLAMAGLFAGLIDAIVGGGGLLAMPALMMTGLPPHLILGTNKFAATLGVMNSAFVYWRKKIYVLRYWLPVVAFAIIASIVGCLVVHQLSSIWLAKAIPFLMIAIVFYMAWPKSLEKKGQPMDYQPPLVTGGIVGSLIGFYDGFFGPGTGSFWTTALVFIFKLDLLQAIAIAKLMNFASNLAALVLFIYLGNVNYPAGLALASGYMLGSYTGAKLAIKQGQRLIKPLFLFIVMLMAIKLIIDNWF